MFKKLLAVAALVSAVVAFADEKQATPDLTDPLLKSKVQVLKRVVAVAVVETKQHNGVVAQYREIYDSVNFKVKPGNYHYLGNWKENKNFEKVFISGLDHDKVTTKGTVYHFEAYGGEYYLYVWPVGIEKLKENGRPVRMKKFTVDPKQALEYYKAQAAKK